MTLVDNFFEVEEFDFEIEKKKIIDFTEFITDFENNNKERNCQTFKDALYEFVIIYNDEAILCNRGGSQY